MEMQGFEKWLLSSRPWQILTERLIVPLATSVGHMPTGGDVLQLGSGGGFETLGLARRFPGWAISATDLDPDMVQLAKQRLMSLEPTVRIEQADATDLPYADGSFDVVVAIGVWHHVGDWPKATLETGRVLRPGGHLLLADLTASFFVGPMRKLFPPPVTYGVEELKPMLARAGFSRYRVKDGRAWYRLIATKPNGVVPERDRRSSP